MNKQDHCEGAPEQAKQSHTADEDYDCRTDHLDCKAPAGSKTGRDRLGRQDGSGDQEDAQASSEIEKDPSPREAQSARASRGQLRQVLQGEPSLLERLIRLLPGVHKDLTDHDLTLIESSPRLQRAITRLAEERSAALQEIQEHYKPRENTLATQCEELINSQKRLKSAYEQLQLKYESGNRLAQEVAALRTKLRESESSHQMLQRDYDRLIETNHDSSRRITDLMNEIARLKRDKSRTYTSSADGRPQNYLLAEELKRTKDQELHSLARDIVRELCDSRISGLERKLELLRVKAILSEQVFIQMDDLLRSNALPTEQELNNLVERSVQAILMELEGRAKNTWSERIRSDLRSFVRKGIDFLERTAQADPPGELWMARRGEPFSPDKHEPTMDSEGAGVVDLPVCPGYLVEGRIFEKALVRTIVRPGELGDTVDGSKENISNPEASEKDNAKAPRSEEPGTEY